MVTVERTKLIQGHLASLRTRMKGRLILPSSGDYDVARSTMYSSTRRPAAIARVADAADVAAVVDFARSNEYQVSVRSGGHSLGHYSVIDEAIVVDFTEMKTVTVDPATRIAWVQAGATSDDLAKAAAQHGLALSTGDTHSVGIGGLTTGGGVGFMVRKYGLAIDNLLSATVVTADGRILTASEDEHSDLFWAIRGGGGNFGIITEFVFRLAPVRDILGGDLMLPATREVIRAYMDFALAAPDDLTLIANVMHAPPAPYVPQDRIGELVLSILVTWTGSMEEGEQVIASLRNIATPVADAVGRMPYPSIYAFTAHQAQPHQASLRMTFADDLSDRAIDSILDAMTNASSPFSIVQIRGLGGAYGRVPNDATAFAHRDRNYFLAVIAIWLDPTEDANPHEAWTTDLWETLRPEGRGVYVNFLEREGPDRVQEAYPHGTYERLQEIKAVYDPGNMFRFNQNILPKGT